MYNSSGDWQFRWRCFSQNKRSIHGVSVESIPTCRRENLEKAPEIRGSVPSSTLGYDNVMEMYTGLGSFAAAIVAHECFANSSRWDTWCYMNRAWSSYMMVSMFLKLMPHWFGYCSIIIIYCLCFIIWLSRMGLRISLCVFLFCWNYVYIPIISTRTSVYCCYHIFGK